VADVLLKNIKKVYEGGVVAAQDINIQINDKEFIVLVGPSGCGKSTTLRMIAGLEEISEGELYIDGKLMNDIPPKDRDIAMVFQNYALYPHMTVFENMAFGLKLRKYPKEEIKSRVNDAANILGIHELLERKPKALSGGQRQRVAVGRAIVRKPKVFLFDEPLSNLDAKLRVQMRTEIAKLHKRLEATMVYVTHDQTEAMTMGDKIVVMKDGFIQQIDTPLNLYNFPKNKFVAGFIGSPAMNFMEGKISNDDGCHFVEDNNGLKFSIPEDLRKKLEPFKDKNVAIGIRPENIYNHFRDDIENNSNLIKISVKLEVVEPMGNEVYLYFSTSTAQITARMETQSIPSAGSTIDLYIDLNKSHFFNKADDLVI
jgi:multiple sugar transport system ATP-binding protein